MVERAGPVSPAEPSSSVGSNGKHHRIEIVHESLLTSWPRLVRWQSQDTEGAHLRDELRQAARLWEQHGRSEDLLWTGAAFRELQLWRDRYPGGLTELEEAFVSAMTRKAERRSRRRRAALAGAFGTLLAVLLVIGGLWHRSEEARREAVLEALRREASQLVSLGRLELEDRPTAALAYAIASLERTDTPEARRFALEALYQGVPAVVVPAKAEGRGLALSPDGQWLATGSYERGVFLWPRDGGDAVSVTGPENGGYRLQFDADEGGLLFVGGSIGEGSRTLHRIFTVPEAEEVYRSDLGSSPSFTLFRGGRLFTVTETEGGEIVRVASPGGGSEVSTLGRLDFRVNSRILDVSGDEEMLAYGIDRSVFVLPLDDLGAGPRLLGEHSGEVGWVRFGKSSGQLVSADASGEVRVWSSDATAGATVREILSGIQSAMVRSDARGATLVVGKLGTHTTVDVGSVWHLEGPPDAEPLILRHGHHGGLLHWLSIDDSGQWLATANGDFAALWPIGAAHARILRGPDTIFMQVEFTPDGRWVVASSTDGAVRSWPLASSVASGRRILIPELDENWDSTQIAVNPRDGSVVAIHSYRGRAILVPEDGSGAPRNLPRWSAETWPTYPAISRDGRLAAAGTRDGVDGHAIEVWDLESGSVEALHPVVEEDRCGLDEGLEALVWDVEFTADGHLLSADLSGLRLWDLETGRSTLLRSCLEGSPSDAFPYFLAAASAGDRYLLLEYDMTHQRHSTLTFYDLAAGTSHEIASHGDYFRAVALDPAGEIVVSGDLDGVVRVGRVSGGEPHLLYGHDLPVIGVAVSPDGEWIASGSQDGTVRLWPMPDLDRPPLHTLPRDELVARLGSFTNLRVVPDAAAETGYGVEVSAFPGWEEVPEW